MTLRERVIRIIIDANKRNDAGEFDPRVVAWLNEEAPNDQHHPIPNQASAA